MSSYAQAQATSLELSLAPIVFRQKALTLRLTPKSSQTLLRTCPLCLSGQSFHNFCVSPIKNPVSLTIV